MNGIIININPVALSLGGFEVRWYSLAIVLAIAAAVFIASRGARAKGIPSEEVYNLLPWLLMSGLVGARLFHVIDRWDDYAGNLWQVFQIQQGGLAIWGGLVGGGLATIIFTRLKHLPLGRLLDVLVPALLAAQIIGRFGCIVNGDAYGAATSLPWGFIYVHPGALIPPGLAGIPTHPYPVYEMMWNALALALVFRFQGRFRGDSQLFLGYLASYSLGRFLLSFVRQENAIWGGLQQAQILAMIILVASLAVLAYLILRARHAGADGSGVQVRG